MRLNTRQVAEKLGITLNTVRTLRDQGSLIDVATRREGASKHYSLFESRQVNEFAKTYVRQLGGRRRNGASGASGVTAGSDGVASRFLAMERLLATMDEKIDALLKLWA